MGSFCHKFNLKKTPSRLTFCLTLHLNLQFCNISVRTSINVHFDWELERCYCRHKLRMSTANRFYNFPCMHYPSPPILPSNSWPDHPVSVNKPFLKKNLFIKRQHGKTKSYTSTFIRWLIDPPTPPDLKNVIFDNYQEGVTWLVFTHHIYIFMEATKLVVEKIILQHLPLLFKVIVNSCHHSIRKSRQFNIK